MINSWTELGRKAVWDGSGVLSGSGPPGPGSPPFSTKSFMFLPDWRTIFKKTTTPVQIKKGNQLSAGREGTATPVLSEDRLSRAAGSLHPTPSPDAALQGISTVKQSWTHSAPRSAVWSRDTLLQRKRYCVRGAGAGPDSLLSGCSQTHPRHRLGSLRSAKGSTWRSWRTPGHSGIL